MVFLSLKTSCAAVGLSDLPCLVAKEVSLSPSLNQLSSYLIPLLCSI